jgi:hypothetical protein
MAAPFRWLLPIQRQSSRATGLEANLVDDHKTPLVGGFCAVQCCSWTPLSFTMLIETPSMRVFCE